MEQINKLEDLDRALRVYDVIDIVNEDGSPFLRIVGGHGWPCQNVRYCKNGSGRVRTAPPAQLFDKIIGKYLP